MPAAMGEAFKLSVVIPVFNEIYTIREVVRRVCASPETWEVIVVDDGSTDGTRDELVKLEAERKGKSPEFRVVYKERNEGKGAALAVAFREARGDAVLIQDGDLEYHPKDYPRLVAPIKEGRAEVVYGSRFMPVERNVLLFWHSVANRMLTLLCDMVANLNLTDVWTGYKVFRTDYVRHLPVRSRGFNFEPEITIKMAKLGCRIVEVPIHYQGRSYAEGKKIGLKDAFIGVWTTIMTGLFADLGEDAFGERSLRSLSMATKYNSFLRDLFMPYVGDEVLEIGAGVGNMSQFMLNRKRLVLTDFEEEYVRYLTSKFQGWENIEVRRLDVTADPGDLKGAFDSIVMLNVLEHIEDDKLALKNLHAMLKPGGRLLLIVPAHQWLYGSLDELAFHFRRYELEPLRGLVESAEFDPEEGFYFSPIGIPGWWLNAVVLRKKVISGFAIKVMDKLTFLHRWTLPMRLPFGMSIFLAARRRA